MRRGGRLWGVATIATAIGMLATACADPTRSPAPSETIGNAIAADQSCDLDAGVALDEGVSVDVPIIDEVNGMTIRAAVYPHPGYEGNPWSQWGQGVALEDGRFFSAIGDHLGVDGNSYVYEYDPRSSKLNLIADVLSRTDHVAGTWGYGKVHSQMVMGPCDAIYFSTYWGTSRDIEFEGNYSGDILFRLDPHQRSLQPLGVPIEHHGQASLAIDDRTGTVYGEALDPVLKSAGVDHGPLFAYDLATNEVTLVTPEEPHVGYRSILVDGDGIAYWSVGDGELQTYDPTTGETRIHDDRMPGEWLRAATEPSADGHIYGVTREPDRFFSMSPSGDIDDLGDARGYTTSLALDPDGSRFFYMPDAHTGAAGSGAPLIAVDTETGEQTIVVAVNDVVESALGYTVGGTYNVAVSPDGSTVYMGANVGAVGEDSTFGEVVMLVIDLP